MEWQESAILLTFLLGVWNLIYNFRNAKRTTFINTVTSERQLWPMIKIMPSPRTEENACYFYNRRQPGGIRFLSYYFETDAEIVEAFDDTASTLATLFSGTR